MDVQSVQFMQDCGVLKMTVSDTDIYRTLKEQIVISEEDDGTYIYNFATGKEFRTEKTGKEILKLLNDKRTTREIAEVLSGKYGEDLGMVLRDVKTFIEEALKEGLIEKVIGNER